MPSPPRLAPHVVQLLDQLRGKIRRYVALRGVALVVAFAAAAFWLLLAIDYWFELARPVRLGLLVVGAVATLYVAWNWLLSRLFVPLSDRSMAVLIERRYDRLGESLLTAIELENPPDDMSDLGREMLAETYQVAARETQGIGLTHMFNRGPLRKAMLAASLLGGTIVGLGVIAPNLFRTGLARVFASSDTPWPRLTRLSLEGFIDGEAVVAKGGDLRVVARAALAGVVPDSVQILYRSADGQRDRKNMVREGNAKADVDEFQPFVHQFQGIQAPIEFDVRGGDARLRGLRIRVVDSPTIASVLYCEYPSYLGQSPREIPVTGSVPVPRGTKVTLRATANKPLVRAVVDWQTADGTNRSADLKPLGSTGNEQRRFDFVIDRLDDDVTLQFTLHDTDKIQNRDAIRVSLVALPDTAPQVNVRLAGIGSAITPQARIPFAGEIIDDYGVERAWIEYTVDQTPPAEQPFVGKLNRLTNIAVAEALEAPALKLKPGQKLQLGARAADAHAHPDQPASNIGQGDRFLLDVVTPDALRAILEARELSLRQRFETIIQEVTEQREAITKLDELPPVAADAAPADPAKKDDQAELERRRLRVERARQNSPKNAEETEGVARAFEEILAELVNNRIDSPELQTRLKGQIADPLHAIAQTRFPELDKRLTALTAALPGNDDARKTARLEVQTQYDVILAEFQQVKAKMLELETFNEALDILRGIITDQKQVTEETKKQNKGSVLKDL